MKEVEKVQTLPRVDALTRIFSVFSRLVLWTVVLGCVLAGALAVVVHGYALPRLNQWTPKLEALIAEQTQLPVRIGSLEAGDKGWLPVLRLRDVAVLDAQQQTRLHVPLVELHVSLVSLLRGGFEQLYVEGLDVQVLRTADGKISIAGQQLTGSRQPGMSAQQLEQALDWFFEQPAFFLNRSRVQWVDKTRNVAPVHADNVQLAVRNGLVYKRFFMAGTPDAQWGRRYVIKGQLQRFFSSARQQDSWLKASGRLYAHFPMLDGELLSSYAAVPHVQIEKGVAATRAWVQVDEGVLQRTTADVYLRDAVAQVQGSARALRLDRLTARLSWRGSVPMFGRSAAATAGTGADTDTDTDTAVGRWKLEQLHLVQDGSVLLTDAQAGGSSHGSGADDYYLRLEQPADLRAARRLSEVLLPALLEDAQFVQVRDTMRALDVQGRVQLHRARCTVRNGAIQRYSIAGRLRDVQWNMQQLTAKDRERMRQRDIPEKWPGVAGLNVDFSMTHTGGTAGVQLRDGHVDVAGVFEDPHIPVQQLDGRVEWQLNSHQLVSFALRKAAFSTPDAAGVVNVAWRESERQSEPASSGGSDAGSYLNISGTFSRADPARVHRYLPVTVRQEVRDYLKTAILGGHAPGGEFQIKGRISDFPWVGAAADEGVFHIGADVQNVRFAFAPPHLAAPGDAPWPVLEGVSGRFDIRGESIFLSEVTGQSGGLQLHRGRAQILDYNHSIVDVQAELEGQAQHALQMVSSSPLRRLTNRQLDGMTGDGSVRLELGLALPISDVNATTLTGTLHLQDNTLRLLPQLPALHHASGTVAFSEKQLQIPDVQAQWLGGAVQISGGTQQLLLPAVQQNSGQPAGFERPMRFDIRGRADAAGLYGLAGILPLAVQRAQQPLLRGETGYAAQLHVNDRQSRYSTHWQVQSDLQGMAVDLPQPLGKAQQTERQLLVRGGIRRAATAAQQPVADGAVADNVAFDNAVLLRYGAPASVSAPAPAPALSGALAAKKETEKEHAGSSDTPLHAYGTWHSGAAGSLRGSVVWGGTVAATAAATATATGMGDADDGNDGNDRNSEGSAGAAGGAKDSSRADRADSVRRLPLDFAANHAALPASGVLIQAHLPPLNVPAWQHLLHRDDPVLTRLSSVLSAALPQQAGSRRKTGNATLSSDASAALPVQLRLRTDRLEAGAVHLDGVHIAAERAGQTLQTSVQSEQLAGTLRYRMATAGDGLLTARLQRLHLPSDALDKLPQEQQKPVQQKPAQQAVAAGGQAYRPAHLPGIDVQIDDVRMGDAVLGRLTLKGQRDAGQHHAGAAWKMQTLRLQSEHAVLDASGYWSQQAAGASQSNLRYTLRFSDVGKTLDGWGFADVIERGNGSLAGHLEWDAPPWSPALHNLRGTLHADIRQGRFLQADPGAAKLLWFFSLQALPRRLTLDFGDAIEKGVAFNTIAGDITAADGTARTDGIRMEGADVDAVMQGQTSLTDRTQNLQVEVVPQIDARGASLVATAINPAVGVGTFIAQSVLGKTLSRAAAQRFVITGSWDAPVVKKQERDAAQKGAGRDAHDNDSSTHGGSSADDNSADDSSAGSKGQHGRGHVGSRDGLHD